MSRMPNTDESIPSDTKSLADIENENRRLRQLASDILLEIAELKERADLVLASPAIFHRMSA